MIDDVLSSIEAWSDTIIYELPSEKVSDISLI